MMRKTQFFIVLLLFNAFQVMSAQTCGSYLPDEHPDSRYTVHNNGTVTDTKTGLMWMVCSVGQRWNAGNCEDIPIPPNIPIEEITNIPLTASLTWEQALKFVPFFNGGEGFAGYKNWRVPDIKELTSLVMRNCSDPAINERIFPNTPDESYWSSSPSAKGNNGAWIQLFKGGHDTIGNRNNSNRVRLVRFGQ